MWIGPTVKIGGLLIQDDPKWVDEITWRVSYKRGYREPRYPVPAIPYDLVSVEVINTSNNSTTIELFMIARLF